MSTGMLWIAGIILLGGLFYVALHNQLIARRNQVDQALASIDVMLKQRYDLIPSLVATVEGYMRHERATLEELVRLRSRAVAGTLGDTDRVDVDHQLGAALGRVLVAVEGYPELRASRNFLQLQAALNEVEEQLSAARRSYNAAVTAYHTAIETFPGNMVAGSMGLKRRPLFEVTTAERAVGDDRPHPVDEG